MVEAALKMHKEVIIYSEFIMNICYSPKTAFGWDIPGEWFVKLFKFDGLRDPPLPEPAEPDPQVLDPDPVTDPESPDEVDIADDKYVGPWLGWQPPQLMAEPPSIDDVVVFAQLKSPLVEGGPSDPNGPGQ